MKIKRLVSEAVMPKKAHASDAGFDIVAVSGGWDESEDLGWSDRGEGGYGSTGM